MNIFKKYYQKWDYQKCDPNFGGTPLQVDENLFIFKAIWAEWIL